MRRSGAGGKPIKGRRRKAPEPKRRNAPNAVARSDSSPTGQGAEIARLTGELNEALEQQSATADVLRIISNSPTEIEPVLDAIVRTAGELCASEYAMLFRLRMENTTSPPLTMRRRNTSSISWNSRSPWTEVR